MKKAGEERRKSQEKTQQKREMQWKKEKFSSKVRKTKKKLKTKEFPFVEEENKQKLSRVEEFKGLVDCSREVFREFSLISRSIDAGWPRGLRPGT